MSHPVSPETLKRRTLVALSSVSVAAIIVLWIFYMNYAIGSPVEPASPDAGASAIFMKGTDVIAASVRNGLVNSYLYFHGIVSEGTTFEIHK